MQTCIYNYICIQYTYNTTYSQHAPITESMGTRPQFGTSISLKFRSGQPVVLWLKKLTQEICASVMPWKAALQDATGLFKPLSQLFFCHWLFQLFQNNFFWPRCCSKNISTYLCYYDLNDQPTTTTRLAISWAALFHEMDRTLSLYNNIQYIIYKHTLPIQSDSYIFVSSPHHEPLKL